MNQLDTWYMEFPRVEFPIYDEALIRFQEYALRHALPDYNLETVDIHWKVIPYCGGYLVSCALSARNGV